MHAYRDAIRDNTVRRVVRYAAILYPGPTASYTAGLEAVQADPNASAAFTARLRDTLLPALSSRRPNAH
jgi:hypothetical protein